MHTAIKADTVTKTVTQVVKTHTLALDDADVRELIKGHYGTAPPAGAKIYVSVPGGGDWSNTDLDISKENPLIIEWVEKTTEVDG